MIFQDGTDIYWARSRVLEYLSSVAGRLPQGVAPQIGPDATGVGWVYQYALLGKNQSLADLRSLQDWYVRYQLTKAGGVAEVASVGGFVKEYQVTVDPHRLATYGIPLERLTQVIRESNRDVGGRVIEMADREYMVRGLGYLRGIEDIENLVLKNDRGTPVLIRDVARVELVPAGRRGLTELNGEGEVVSGIVMARFGQNALDVIANVKAKLKAITAGLPAGTRIIPVYDRSTLIERAIANLKDTLFEESLIVAAVCVIFLLHVRSALVAIITLPLGVLIAFIAMRALGLGSNIMSLGGIAIAIGAMVDAAIVMIENAHKRLEHLAPDAPSAERSVVMIKACKEVGPALVLFAPDHHRFVPAGVHARGSGGPPVCTAGLHQDLRHGRRGAAVGDAGAGADDDLHPRPYPARDQEPAEPLSDLVVSADHRLGNAAQGSDPGAGAGGNGRHGLPGQPARFGVHADAQRRHLALHAGLAARSVGDRSGAAIADHRPDHQDLSRGRVGLRQGRPRRHCHRSGAAGNV